MRNAKFVMRNVLIDDNATASTKHAITPIVQFRQREPSALNVVTVKKFFRNQQLKGLSADNATASTKHAATPIVRFRQRELSTLNVVTVKKFFRNQQPRFVGRQCNRFDQTRSDANHALSSVTGATFFEHKLKTPWKNFIF